MVEKEFVRVSISDLIPYDNNPRKNDNAVPDVAESIKQCGDLDPIEIDENNVILAGHTRLMALMEQGFTETDVIRYTGLTEEQKKKYRILSNKTGEKALWDFDALAEELEGLDFDDYDFGFDLDFDGNEEPAEIVEDEAPKEVETRCKLGDIFQLGNHRLICGDSTDPAVIDRLMDGVKADCVFTDPPYNLQTEGGCKGSIGKSLRKQGKDIEFIADFNPSDFLNVLPIVFNGNMNAYIFCNKELLPDYLNWCKNSGYSWNVLIWKKPSAIPIGDSHRPDIEYLLLFRKNALWNNGTDANYSRCLQYDRVKKSEENGNHPTPKPIELIANELKISSNKNSVVVDFFGGSGSTLIACEQLNRKCYMCELDEHYCSVILQRYINFKGSDADVFLLKDGRKIPYSDVW